MPDFDEEALAILDFLMYGGRRPILDPQLSARAFLKTDADAMVKRIKQEIETAKLAGKLKDKGVLVLDSCPPPAPESVSDWVVKRCIARQYFKMGRQVGKTFLPPQRLP